MADIGDLRYDRTVTEDFLSVFRDGFAASLVDYARGKYPIDFQFRKDPKTGRQWATLYVGMTAVVNVIQKGPTGFLLKAHKTYQDPALKLGWSPEWLEPASASSWAARWDAVERYLERVITKVVTDGKFVTTEGIVQASVSGFRDSPDRAVVDREVMPHFKDTATRKAIVSSYNDPLVEILKRRPPVPGTPPARLGIECDALALDKDGTLVAIEIKPGSVSSLAWVAAQATMYGRVLQHWLDKDPTWRETVRATVRQREELGLLPHGFAMPGLRPMVRPAVAFQRIASNELVARMYAVQDMLVDSGVGHPDLQFYSVAPSGRLEEHSRP